MGSYRKDFAGWAKVAEMVERGERAEFYKSGVIYWANLGVNIGSSEDGKGERFVRPVLILEKINQRMVMAVPVTSRVHNRRGYHEVIVTGKLESLALEQTRPIDILRVGDFIDEVAPVELERIWKHWMRLMKYHFYKKSSPAEAERDF